MAKYKERTNYYLMCNGKLIEVNEDIYRTWMYYHNKEKTAMKQFCNRTKTMPDGTQFEYPSRCVSLDDPNKPCNLSGQINIESAFIHKELIRLLDEALSHLDSQYEQVIRSLFYSGKTEQELAKEMGKCQATISNYKNQALKCLRTYFEHCEYSLTELLEMLDD